MVFRLLFSWSNFSAVGSKVCVRRPISLCTGEVLSPSLGVLRQERIANNESRLSSFAFKSSPLQVFTAFSTFPFTCGYLGPEVLVLELPICREILEFLVVKFGPLLLISTSGMPCRANCTLNWVIAACAVLL